MGTIARLEGPMEAALDGSSTVVLDLSSLSFIDSCGLRLLLRTSERARRLGRAFFIVRPSAQVSRVVEVTETGEVLPLVSDRDAPGSAAPASGNRREWKAQTGPLRSSPAPPAASGSSWPGSSPSTASI